VVDSETLLRAAHTPGHVIALIHLQDVCELSRHPSSRAGEAGRAAGKGPGLWGPCVASCWWWPGRRWGLDSGKVSAWA
jgi:hypothetical protein